MIDGAHNPHGMAALAAALEEEFGSIEWVAVVGAMRDKDLAMFEALEPSLEHFVCTEHPSERAVPAEDLARSLKGSVTVPVHVEPDPIAAVAHARDLAGDDGGVVVAGSLYLVGDVRRDLGAIS
jgi:dihydrofolate synthase/folylpolyglutamate synthase